MIEQAVDAALQRVDESEPGNVDPPPEQGVQGRRSPSPGPEYDNTAPDEWEGEIVEENDDSYVVKWKTCPIPKGFANREMVAAWKAKLGRTLSGPRRESSQHGVKKRGAVKAQSVKQVNRRRGRPRKT
jgi:hypothetical protein